MGITTPLEAGSQALLTPAAPIGHRIEAFLATLPAVAFMTETEKAQIKGLSAGERVGPVRARLESLMPPDFPVESKGRGASERRDWLGLLCDLYTKSLSSPQHAEGREAFAAMMKHVQSLRNMPGVLPRVDDEGLLERMKAVHGLAEHILKEIPQVGWLAFCGGFIRGRAYTRDIDVWTYSCGEPLCSVRGDDNKWRYTNPEHAAVFERIQAEAERFIEATPEMRAMCRRTEEYYKSHPDEYRPRPLMYGVKKPPPTALTVEAIRLPFALDTQTSGDAGGPQMLFCRSPLMIETGAPLLQVFFNPALAPMDSEVVV